MNDKSRPDYTSEAYDAMEPDLTLCRDVAKGTSRVRAAGTEYLPRHPRERMSDYDARLKRSVVYNMLGRTIRGLTGMVFREDMKYEDVPSLIEKQLEDIDLQGNHVDVFLKDLFSDSLEAGHAFVLVDAPQRDERVRTRRDEQLSNLRPYWNHVKKENVLSWRTIDVNGSVKLQQVVIKEPGVEPDGEFGEQEITRYRILRRADPVQWETWIKRENGDPVREAAGTINNVSEIPLVPCYANRTGFFMSDPPMLDLAYITVSHYQVQSDHLTALNKSSVPVLAITGVADTDEPVEVGPNVTFTLPVGADVKYVEHDGSALDATRQQLLDLENRGAALGLAMLQHETRQAETAQAKRIDKSEQDSALATAARGLQDCVEQCLMFHAMMLRLGDSGGSVVVNREYDTLSLSAQEIAALSALVSSGQMSLDTLWQIMAEAGTLPDNFDPELERANLEAEAVSLMSEFQAQQEAAQQQQQEQPPA